MVTVTLRGVRGSASVTDARATRYGTRTACVDYAVSVAAEAGARCLAPFHHDPQHDDDLIDALLAGARRAADRLGVDEGTAAGEGTTVPCDR